MNKVHRSLLLAGSLAGLFAMGVPAQPAEAQVKIQFRFGTPDRPLQGRYYTNMTALAHYLDEEAWQASNIANEQVAYSPRTQAVIANIDEFANRASQFHDRMDGYLNRPWDVQREVIALDEQAQRVNRLMRRARVYSSVAAQWNDVLQALDLMKQSLAGVEVRVPSPHRRFRYPDYDTGPTAGIVIGGRDGGVVIGGDRRDRDRGVVIGGDRDRDRREAGNYNPGYPASSDPRAPGYNQGRQTGSRVLAGRELDEFRASARELDQVMARVVEASGRYQGNRGFDENVHGGLRQLNNEVSSLWQNVDQEQIDPARWLPTLQRMVTDAANLEQSLRSAGTEPNVIPDLWKSRQIMERMVKILQ